MTVYFLKDIAEDCVDAVIIAETSTKNEIEDAILDAKQNDEYQWQDIVDALPDDCTIHDKWSCDTVWY